MGPDGQTAGMGVEVEHKFLVSSDSWRAHVLESTRIVQGYLARGRATVRVRIRAHRAFLTVKGPTSGVSRSEFEYPIPVEDAQLMLDELADGPVVEKVRHLVRVDEHIWEVDEFGGANAPLVMAEVELRAADEEFALPEWAGQDVSDDQRYYNVNLATTPYSTWSRG